MIKQCVEHLSQALLLCILNISRICVYFNLDRPSSRICSHAVWQQKPQVSCLCVPPFNDERFTADPDGAWCEICEDWWRHEAFRETVVCPAVPIRPRHKSGYFKHLSSRSGKYGVGYICLYGRKWWQVLLLLFFSFFVFSLICPYWSSVHLAFWRSGFKPL